MGKKQKGQQKALYMAGEYKQRQCPRRRIAVNQLNFVPEYKEYTVLGVQGHIIVCVKWDVPITNLVYGSRVL